MRNRDKREKLGPRMECYRQRTGRGVEQERRGMQEPFACQGLARAELANENVATSL